MSGYREIEARLSQLEESLAAKNRTLEDFPELLMRVLWRMVHEAVECHDPFPNGQYETETTDE